MYGLRGERQDSAFVLLALGREFFDRTGLTDDSREAHPDHLLAAGVSSGAPVRREVALSDSAPAACANPLGTHSYHSPSGVAIPLPV